MVTCRATDENRGLISRQIMEALGPDGLLVNVSRGQVVDEDALIAALNNGRLGMAALDVFQTEPTPADRWRDVPNVVRHHRRPAQDGRPDPREPASLLLRRTTGQPGGVGA